MKPLVHTFLLAIAAYCKTIEQLAAISRHASLRRQRGLKSDMQAFAAMAQPSSLVLNVFNGWDGDLPAAQALWGKLVRWR